MSELKEKLQQRLARSRTVHQELIQPAPAPQPTPEPIIAKAVAPNAIEVDSPPRPGRPKKIKRKVTTLYFDEDLDKALEMFLLRQYLQTGTKTSKSEWIRGLVETSLKEHNAWPPQE
ncbi:MULTISPECIES: hypothetical protein [Alicyclobacillus]|uniref:Uncharacterized protein n=1 Tax=Alicyclobacillus acidoterrestris (strain ATCC 49025 / DSM 3922 / CIP 106132 / NCIMB 13137 / GD3B) TaxID=1356854 RepID=T0BJJ7_ALIAG|nr:MULTISPECIES: hypothetical protein [Alicyclobacillus]EPZ44138.1 hypothetical protein N007_11485 [Alicyclobacillus acidoterrestris ATCC 49025]UNO49657.1 hypothetical protein K1I37_03715 [Alicyclobacillus acidoterrestris]